ncbi:lipoprotein-releasing system permease protein [Desulfonatronum thiosulfatophilum]|uniref:Lipoprotein-releasing system permease protein n=1 Tax=Desulfonatronum thiosulfatophilum TaxID=617002 RepID=A0A1G6C6M7_9BACT|nr:lipoprotein-releasing ABC transporter permease subunit [Desulfonatronum thiosulfatophilum]SDB28492.1 lipoprotein-releasing system permease protein [Desulfonatronum thiosulfatophilum]
MRFERFIALRYLLTKRNHAFISVISWISILGVALGVASLIVVLGVMNGFSNELRDKILGVNAHIVVTSLEGTIRDYEPLTRQAAQISGVAGAMPFMYSEVMLSTSFGVKGVVLRGIDPELSHNVITLSDDLIMGDVRDLVDVPEGYGIFIGAELAGRLGLRVGSPVNLLSPAGQRTAAGFSPSVKNFVVRGIFRTGMYEYDSSLAYVTIPAAQSVMGFREDLVTGLEVRLHDVYAAPRVASDLADALGGFPLHVRTWMEMNQNLFAALKLEKTAMFVILVMIVLVGSFSIITTLVMLVMEKTRDIAILASMGAGPKRIGRIFIFLGTVIGVLGTSLGFAIGLLLSYLLQRYQFIQLPMDVYYLDHLPVQLQWSDLTIIAAAAMGMCFLATLYPARQASRLQPAEALRYE